MNSVEGAWRLALSNLRRVSEQLATGARPLVHTLDCTSSHRLQSELALCSDNWHIDPVCFLFWRFPLSVIPVHCLARIPARNVPLVLTKPSHSGWHPLSDVCLRVAAPLAGENIDFARVCAVQEVDQVLVGDRRHVFRDFHNRTRQVHKLLRIPSAGISTHTHNATLAVSKLRAEARFEVTQGFLVNIAPPRI